MPYFLRSSGRTGGTTTETYGVFPALAVTLSGWNVTDARALAGFSTPPQHQSATKKLEGLRTCGSFA